MFVVGLTGDVGAGKSTLSDVWRTLGAKVIDADEAAKRQWLVPEIRESAAARWGREILCGGGVDFARIAEIAFADEDEYRYMIDLIHPATRADLTREVRASGGWVVAEIPLLFEGACHDWIDFVVYATAPIEDRIARNRVRGWDGEEVARRERFLLDSREKRAMADLVLFNDSTLEVWAGTARRTGALFARMGTVRELLTCCGSKAEAETIACLLAERRLAACVNISRVRSVYRWQGKIETGEEWRLVCKTTEGELREAVRCIRENHSYDLPAITWRDSGGKADTLRWVAESCGDGDTLTFP